MIGKIQLWRVNWTKTHWTLHIFPVDCNEQVDPPVCFLHGKADLVAGFSFDHTSVRLPDASLLVDLPPLVCDGFGQAVQISYRIQHCSIFKLQAVLDATLF